MKNIEKFGWICGYEHINGSFHADHERCTAHSIKLYDRKEDAASAALKYHKKHSDSVAVYSTTKGYIGLAVGLNFNTYR